MPKRIVNHNISNLPGKSKFCKIHKIDLAIFGVFIGQIDIINTIPLRYLFEPVVDMFYVVGP